MNLAAYRSVFRRLLSNVITCVAFALGVLLIDPAVIAQGGRTNERWVGTWTTALVARPQTPPQAAAPQNPTGQATNGQSPQRQAPQTPAPPLNFKNQTLRQIVRTSIGGDQVRVVFSNAFGIAPLPIGAAHVALRDKGAAIIAKSSRKLTFGGRSGGTIPAGAVLMTDPVTLTVPPLADLAIDLYLPGDTAASTSPLATHGGTGGLQTNYISEPGDHTGATDLPVMTTTLAWFFVARVEVAGAEGSGAVVTLGDSITDGSHSSPDTNNRWPNHLAKRLAIQPGKVKLAVLNAGISGNRLLSDGGAGASALARLDRDVLVPTGVTHVIVLLGINDIGARPRANVDDLIVGHRQLIERGHAHGLKVYGATVTPFEATTIANYWSEEGEAMRQALNQWIRTSRAYDGVIDFDAIMRDPSHPTKILPQYDSGDHLHPNDAGYQYMADAIDLTLFKAGRR